MTPIDPSRYVAVYCVVIFLVPWLIYASFIVRALLYSRRNGISLFSWTASSQMRMLRQTDRYAAFLYRQTRRWFIIMMTMWFVGFAVMGLTLYLLHRRGIV
jgi:hypothetical protein